MGTVELVIACHEIHLKRQQGSTYEDIVQPGGVVADEEEGTFDFPKILLEIVVDMILGVNKQLPDQTQGIVDPVGVADLSFVNGFFHRNLFHISLSFP